MFPKLPSRPRLSPAPLCLCEVASLRTSQRPLPPAQRPVFGARRAHSSGYLSLSSAPAMSPWKQADKLIPAQVRCQKALIYCSLLYLLPSLKFAEGRRSGALFPSPAGRASPTHPQPRAVLGPPLSETQSSEPLLRPSGLAPMPEPGTEPNGEAQA